MKRFILICAAAAFALTGASAAVASDHDWDSHHDSDHHDHDGDHHDHDGDHQDHDGDHHNHDGDHGWNNGDHHKGWSKNWDRNNGWWNRPHRWRNHSWHRGDRFRRFDGDNYMAIDEWWFYGLDRPPRGYHWVRTWDGFVLVSNRGGFVLNFVIR